MTETTAPADPASGQVRSLSVRTEWLLVVVVFTVALSARLIPVLRGGGLYGLSFYDDGVHYAAATGLIHGQMPYRQFLFLQPPGIALLLAPFAALAHWVGDSSGLAAARVSFMALGATNAVLVSRFVRPSGLYGAWLAGLVYALFWPAIYSEHTTLLEGPANTCLLIALLLLGQTSAEVRPSTPRVLLAGALLGFAAAIKIWGVVPIAIIAGWMLVRRRGRGATILGLGAAAGCTAACLPFFLAAPGAMWRLVVLDQVQRNDGGLRLFERLNAILGLTLFSPPARVTLPLLLAGALLLGAIVLALRAAHVRPAVLLLLGLGTLLLVTPSWFLHYTALTAAVMAITIGAAGQQLLRLPPVSAKRVLRVSVAAAMLVGLLAVSTPLVKARIGQHFPGQTLGQAVASRPGCVTSDHPGTLILLNVLSRNIDRGCKLVVDLGGASYDLPSPDRGRVSRQKNTLFQAYALAYLRTGDTAILARFRKGYGLDTKSFATVQHWPIVGRAGRYLLHQPQK